MDLSRLPNSVKDFEKLITEGRIYVDKTDLIYSLAINNSQPIFLSRPRRFGKSLLVSTFECLFKQKHELFKGLKIENLWKDQNTYKVLHLDFSSMATSSLEAFLKAFNNALDVF
ncbi:MAG: AAA family ATPase, partial [Succinivibrio sp.]|nr:AAA family ATPase [Succinivibrio sp.]